MTISSMRGSGRFFLWIFCANAGIIIFKPSKRENRRLIFDYEILLSGLTLKRPVNYDLARIIPPKDNSINPNSRPIIVIDPRAGNGPGIGGSKRDSEIGDALAQGHPVYFILFHPEPVLGQTIADVEQAEILFIEEVSRRHPKAPKPAVIGNCQAKSHAL